MRIHDIEKNLPIPEKPEPKYPFAIMDIGDSFKVSGGGDRKELVLIYNRVRASAHAFGRRYGHKFSIRKQNDFVRIWKMS